jgi:hypothetical protein
MDGAREESENQIMGESSGHHHRIGEENQKKRYDTRKKGTPPCDTTVRLIARRFDLQCTNVPLKTQTILFLL